jgi:fructose-1,6-bisphosphatase-3
MSITNPLQTADSQPDLAVLRSLSQRFPNIDVASAEIARLSAELTLPKGTIHIISDVHGDDVKMRHVINNASGTLRPLVEGLFSARLSAAEVQEFIRLIFYPKEMLKKIQPTLGDAAAQVAFARRTLQNLFALVRHLARQFSVQHVQQLLPPDYRALLQELLSERAQNDSTYVNAVVDSLVAQGRAFRLIRLTVRVVRDLAISELINAGDFWDRGPRGDRVVDYLMRQPNVAITWGNHDAAWMGACLGQEALIAHVLRISARYRRFSQLEEGYGITLQPLEHLVREVYGDDPAECYVPKGHGLRETIQMARMQKAAAIMQFKLEGQTIQRNPEWGLDARRLLQRIDHQTGTIAIDGAVYPLRDKHFPTIDPHNPYELSAAERTCMDRLRKSFAVSQKLYGHIHYLKRRGAMWLVRDDHLIFHGCVPVDEKGEFLPLVVEGKPLRGRELFDGIEQVVVRTIESPTDKGCDLLWYLWCGPLSPLFGKDRITTLENDLVADPKTHVETKNPYFSLIHEVPFCDKVMKEFGVDPQRGLIVNGHVPVKIDKGENPLKRSGKCITIDGAFSSAYGDHGYTLVLEADRTFLAKHYHFESVEAAVRDGVDIIPQTTVIRQWPQARRVSDTERGAEIRADIALLERLVAAYLSNRLRQNGQQGK